MTWARRSRRRAVAEVPRVRADRAARIGGAIGEIHGQSVCDETEVRRRRAAAATATATGECIDEIGTRRTAPAGDQIETGGSVEACARAGRRLVVATGDVVEI